MTVAQRRFQLVQPLQQKWAVAAAARIQQSRLQQQRGGGGNGR
jgi:hypothetical protein